MLYLIGLGLNDEKDISFKGLKIAKKASKIYLENYTSKMQCKKEDLERFYGKDILEVDRDFVEKKIEEIFEDAKKEDIVFLVKGDVYSATTHIDLYLRAKKKNVPVKVILGTSIITAVGVVGLNLYNFGKVVSIPLNLDQIKMNLEEATKIIDKIKQEKIEIEDINKKIIILQTIKVPLWNISYITSAFNILNVKINAITKEIIEQNLTPVFNFRKPSEPSS